VNQTDRDRYQQVAEDLRRRIDAAEFKVGERLPAIPAIAEAYGVARNTAHDAVRMLAQWGLVISKSGSGTYVRARPGVRRLIRCYDRARQEDVPITHGLDAETRRQGNRSYTSQSIYGPVEVRARLGLGEPDLEDRPDVMQTEYLHEVEDEPAMLVTSWERLTLTRGTPIVLPEEGPYAGRGVLERLAAIGVAVDSTSEVVGARAVTPEEGVKLQLPPGAVALTIRRTFRAGDGPVETADYVLPADQIELAYAWHMDQPARD
jgi:GntR family transcriptional regulator